MVTDSKIERKVALFDSFAFACKYFDPDSDVNNGYGCDHPDQKETDPDESGVERGKCYNFSCPLGIEPDAEDFNNPAVDCGGTTIENCTDAESGEFDGSEYIMVNVGTEASEEEKEAWSAYDRYINRYNR